MLVTKLRSQNRVFIFVKKNGKRLFEQHFSKNQL